jgi:copper resistance protein B
MSNPLMRQVALVATTLLWSLPGHTQHVPPDPPASQMPDMPYSSMTKMMGMDDTGAVGKVLLDQFEWQGNSGGNAAVWDATGFYGTDYNKLWLRTEGERVGGHTEDARAEAFWDRIISRWWSSQIGLRHDFGPGPARDWLAVGVQGLAPYYLEVEATAYVGDSGRTALRLKTEYELLFTQRLILQPEIELNAYGKADPDKGVGSGLSEVQAGLRLRYEIRRELAPYIGLAWERRTGNTAALLRANGKEISELRAVAGVRLWF